MKFTEEKLDKMLDKVRLESETLHDLLNANDMYVLKIPDYQRIYCWEEKQVIRLLDDIQSYADKTYHMGNIILHKRADWKKRSN